MPSATSTLSKFHPDLVAALGAEANRAADRVIDFFHRMSDPATAAALQKRETLLELGAAFTLAAWEYGGVTVHRDAGLPSARIVGRYALATALPNVRPAAPSVMTQVLGLFVDHMAWNARTDLDADVALNALDEDALIDAVAQLVWARRHDRLNATRTNP